MKKYVYLAGKMTGLSYNEMHSWRIKASMILHRLNVSVLDPTALYDPTYDFDYDSEQEVMRYELRAVKHAKVILVNLDKIETSVGTVFEIATAFENNLPIIGFSEHTKEEYMEKSHPWILEATDRVFWYPSSEETKEDISLNNACEYIQKYYFEKL